MKNQIMLLSLLISVFYFSILQSLAIKTIVPNGKKQEYVTKSNNVTFNHKVLRIYFDDRRQLDTLAGFLDIWEVNHREGWLITQVTTSQWQELELEGYKITLEVDKTKSLSFINQLLPGQVTGIPSFPCYRTVEEIYASLANLQNNHSNLFTFIDIGDSWEKVQPGDKPGYDILAGVLTNQDIEGAKPRLILIGAIHAREYVTSETVIRFAESLINNYGVDPDVTWLIDNFELHIIPIANPDGRKIAETGISWRKNTDSDDGCINSNYWGTDLNRNSSFAWGGSGSSSNPCDETYRGTYAASEPEIQAIQTYITSQFPDMRGPNNTDPAPLDTQGMLISLHSYGQLVLWPWGYTPTNSPNHVQLQTLGRKIAYFNSYYPEPASGLYTVSGSTDDWSYGELGLASITIEMGTNFFQDCESFENTVYPQTIQGLHYALKAVQAPYQSPSGPDVVQLALSDTPSDQIAILSGVVTDTHYSNANGIEPTQIISSASFTIDQFPWTTPPPESYPLTPTDGIFDETVEEINASINTSGLNDGRHILYVRGEDADGNWGVPTAIYLDIENGEPNNQPIRIFLPLIHQP